MTSSGGGHKDFLRDKFRVRWAKVDGGSGGQSPPAADEISPFQVCLWHFLEDISTFPDELCSMFLDVFLLGWGVTGCENVRENLVTASYNVTQNKKC